MFRFLSKDSVRDYGELGSGSSDLPLSEFDLIAGLCLRTVEEEVGELKDVRLGVPYELEI